MESLTDNLLSAAPRDIHGYHDSDTDGKKACLCGKSYSRLDSLNRHIRTVTKTQSSGIDTASSLTATNKYPCNLCNKHSGNSAFVRRDHLRQHLRVYHKYNKESIDGYCKALLDSRGATGY